MKSKKTDMYIKEGLFGEQEKEEVGEWWMMEFGYD
jgi:hypothetical protein